MTCMVMHRQQAINGVLFLLEVCVLPGEVEEDLPAYAPAFCRCTQLELFSTDMEHKTHTPPKNTENQVCKQLIAFVSPQHTI